MHPTKFEDHLGLARLPYFEVVDRHRIVLADPSLGPAIDCHTHLALAYLVPMRLDLHAAHESVEHYLPLYRPLDLDVYMNRTFTAEDLARLQRDLTLRSVTARGMRATHTVANLEREMRDLGIQASVILPIDLPLISDNAGLYLREAMGRKTLVGFGSVHPLAPQLERRLDRQLALGARGIKVHPTVQLVRPDCRRALRLYRLCADRGLPVLWHCGPVGIEPRLGRYLSQLKHYVRPVRECPETTFILGHSGALQMEEAVRLARTCQNVYLELASQSVSNIRRILDQVHPDRVLFGSDWPFYHQATALAKVLLATEGDPALRRRVLYENAARLLRL